MIGEVALEGMEFYARHGYYDEERRIGNKYSVDVVMRVEMEKAVTEDKLDGTINYEQVYKIVSEVMAIDAKLLEHLAGKLINRLKSDFDQLEAVKVRVSKYNPPIMGLCKTATVTLEG